MRGHHGTGDGAAPQARAAVIELPDTLVLGAGGTLGEAWMRGLLSGIESAAGLDFRGCEYLVGTSAGSIVAAALAAGRRPEAGDRAAREWAEEAAEPEHGRPLGAALRALGGELARTAGRLSATAASPLAPITLAGLAPAGRAVRAAALAAAPRPDRTLDSVGAHIDSLGAEFDGRLRIAAVERRTGRRVLFGAPGAPAASVRDAVVASCAVPWLFAPVQVGGREYVDGGVWSPANLDAAPGGRGARVLCLAPTATAGPLRAPTAAALVAEEMALKARGMRVRTIAPDAGSAAAIGPSLMDGGRVEAVLDAAFAQGRATARE
jgi:NTE family protein